MAHVSLSHETWREQAPLSTRAPEPTWFIPGARNPLHLARLFRLAEPTSPFLRSGLSFILDQL